MRIIIAGVLGVALGGVLVACGSETQELGDNDSDQSMPSA